MKKTMLYSTVIVINILYLIRHYNEPTSKESSLCILLTILAVFVLIITIFSALVYIKEEAKREAKEEMAKDLVEYINIRFNDLPLQSHTYHVFPNE